MPPAPRPRAAGRLRDAAGRGADAGRDDRSGLRRPRLRSVFCRVRRVGDLHRRRRVEDSPARRRPDADLRARSRRSRSPQRRAATTAVHHRLRGERGRCGADLHRRGDAVAPRRRSCRPVVRVRRGAQNRAAPARIQRAGGQVHRPGRHRTAGLAHRDGGQSGGGIRRRLEPGIPPRGSRDRRLHAPGSRRESASRATARRKGCARSTGR